MITVHNTLGHSVQPFEPIVDGAVGMYVCGPTVQSAPHLGHGRFAVAFDAIRRYLSWRGYDVTYVQNVTDIDDKIISNAAAQGIPPEHLANEMAEQFQASSNRLNVLVPNVEPRATDHIGEMVGLIGRLIDQGLAYPAQGDVYFRVRALDGYGKLSGHDLDDLLSGARIEPGDQKEDPLDFALWKSAKPGEPQWESPWGPGRPGWHIECSAMAAKYLGESFDIHAGGNDLIFPHHENEIAQSEGASGQPFARYWLHNGMVNLVGEKMAKSTGHIIDLEIAIDTYGGAAVRLFYLRAQYRSPLEFSEELLEDAATSMERLRAFGRRSASAEHVEADEGLLARFSMAMDDDFNTPEALAVLFDAVRLGNTALDADDDVAATASAFLTMADVLGLDLSSDSLDDLAARIDTLAESLGVASGDTPDATMAALVEARGSARADKQWEVADGIRNGLAELGIVIEDSADGARWHRR